MRASDVVSFTLSTEQMDWCHEEWVRLTTEFSEETDALDTDEYLELVDYAVTVLQDLCEFFDPSGDDGYGRVRVEHAWHWTNNDNDELVEKFRRPGGLPFVCFRVGSGRPDKVKAALHRPDAFEVLDALEDALEGYDDWEV